MSRCATPVMLLGLLGALSACGAKGPQATPAAALPPGATTPPGHARLGDARRSSAQTPFRFFAPSSFWNAPVPENARLDPASQKLVAALDATIAAEELQRTGPWINTTQYSMPVYTVPANQPTVSVTVDHHARAHTLEAAWSAVPLPANAHPATGTDGLLTVWQPSTDRLWEFWRLTRAADGWHASWGGAMQRVSTNPGVYGPNAWPGAKPWWGASASSLALVGGLISLEDFELGEINHALSMSLPARRVGIYASPAQRTDGRSPDPLTLPEGAHLRLNPHLDLTTLHLPPLTLMLAQAAQRYGIIIKGGARIATFDAQDPTPTGANPFIGPSGYFEGKLPSQLLASFPWSQLQVLKMELHHFRLARTRANDRLRRRGSR